VISKLHVHKRLEIKPLQKSLYGRLSRRRYSCTGGRILERSGVIAQAVLTKIYRQQVPGLREAIEDLSRGRTGEGFDKLDKFGVIHEIADDAGRLKAIAEKQMEAVEAQRSSLIVAPTHGECRAIAGAVRQVMKDKGLLSGAEHSVTRLERLNLTESQQRDAVAYEPGQIVEFHRGSEAWKEQSDPIFRFWAEGDWWGFPFFSLSASRYFGNKETLCLYWPVGILAITGPKVLDFYQRRGY
jgi:hypothetical protein